MLTSRRNHTAVAYVRGELDLATADQLASALRALAEGRRCLVIDLRGVDFIDVQGLRALQVVCREVRSEQIDTVVVASECVAWLLDELQRGGIEIDLPVQTTPAATGPADTVVLALTPRWT